MVHCKQVRKAEGVAACRPGRCLTCVYQNGGQQVTHRRHRLCKLQSYWVAHLRIAVAARQATALCTMPASVH